MKRIVVLIGLLLLGVKVYFDYAQSPSSESDKISQGLLSQEEKRSVETDVIGEDLDDEETIEEEIDRALATANMEEEDVAVKESIEEEIPLEEIEEIKDEQEAMVEEQNEDVAVKNEIEEMPVTEDIEKIIEEQEALIHEGVNVEEAKVEQPKREIPTPSEEQMIKKELDEEEKMIKRENEAISKDENEDERIIKEEEEKMKQMMEEG